MPLSLKFEVIEGALSYRVMLARDRDFKDVVQEKVVASSEKLEITGIDDGTYFLQSLSIDDSGIEGLPSRPVEIKIRVNPRPPFIESPVEGAEYRKGTVSFKWLNVKDASLYHVQVAEDREFNLLVEDRKDIKSTDWIVRNLNFKRHWFRVSSIADDGYEGPWSDPLSFTVLPPPPAPPVEKPELDKKEIRIRWGDLGKGIRYQFQMARDAEFQNILSERELEQPEITLPNPEEPGTYYVRVKGIGPEGIAGDFSSPQKLKITHGLPYVPLGILLLIGLLLLVSL